jgi:hypothetical protein
MNCACMLHCSSDQPNAPSCSFSVALAPTQFSGALRLLGSGLPSGW